MKSKASFPRRVCILWLNRKISSACAAVSPDVKTERPTCTPTSCPVPDGGTSVSTDTSAPKPWLAGADPLLRSTDGMLIELRTGRLGAAGGNKNEGGGGRSGESGCLRSRDLPLSVLLIFGVGMLGRILGLKRSATFEPTRRVLTYRLTAFSTNIPAKPFALCLMFMFRFV